jgi:hypothetical protein
MAVSDNYEYLKRLSLQINCDLLRAGLIPGIGKCIWDPIVKVDWNGLTFDFVNKELKVLDRRIQKTLTSAIELKANWPYVSYRTVARFVGKIMSMHPVLIGLEQVKTRKLQSIVNIRNYKNLSWDSVIKVDFQPILRLALKEIEYWTMNIITKNVRKFQVPVSNMVAWTDASDVAIGGLAVTLRAAEFEPITADNWLLDKTMAYRTLKSCANMQTALSQKLESKTVIIRDSFDLDPYIIENLLVVRRNLQLFERVTDSNERELMAALYLIDNCSESLQNKTVTLHFDNMNAASICTKGSPKIRLQEYAEKIYEKCQCFNITLRAVWIPRDLNNVADLISKEIDYDDYQITVQFFNQITEEFGVTPNIDCFANGSNTKSKNFFSLYYEKGTSGIDCFNYDWKQYGICWLFPPPRLLGRAVNYAKHCRAEALLLLPQWKHSHFYAICKNIDKKCVRKVVVFDGSNVFKHGFDTNSYFGPRYKGSVEVYWLNFSSYTGTC